MNPSLVFSDPSIGADAPRNVMVVEDDPVVRRLLRLRLHKAGLAVMTASTGEEAMEMAESSQRPVHVVITDGVMPGVDGFEVARYFLRYDPTLPVILLSGYLHHFVSRPDIPENICAFFEKPFSADELTAKVLELLGVPA